MCSEKSGRGREATGVEDQPRQPQSLVAAGKLVPPVRKYRRVCPDPGQFVSTESLVTESIALSGPWFAQIELFFYFSRKSGVPRLCVCVCVCTCRKVLGPGLTLCTPIGL